MLCRAFIRTVSRHLVSRRHLRLASIVVRRCLHGRGIQNTASEKVDGVADDVRRSKYRTMILLDRLRQPEPLPEDRTSIANDFLHLHLLHKASRHRRRVTRSLQAFRRLVMREAFIPDRVTTNILTKGLLRWAKEVDKQTVRGLFDNMIANGYLSGGLYPEGSRPFRSDITVSPTNLALPKITSALLFTRHIRPLYKMMIRAMTARKDHEGARVVTDVLRAVKAQYIKQCVNQGTRQRVGRKRKVD